MQVRKQAQEKSPPSQRGEASAQSWCCLGAVFLLHLSSSQHPNPGLLRSHTPASLSLCPPSTQAVGGGGGSGQRQNFVESGGNCPATQCSHTFVVHGFAHTHPCYMPDGLSRARIPGHLDTPAQGRHKSTHSIHPMQRNLMHSCSHLFSAFTDAHLGLRASLDL